MSDQNLSAVPQGYQQALPTGEAGSINVPGGTEYVESVCMCLCIDGALRWPDSLLRKVFTNNGQPVTAKYARDYLKMLKAKGARVMKMDGCDNFDDQKGCLGHRVKKT